MEAYIAYVKSRSERERMAEKKISGCFTGSYVLNPFNGRKIPVWISEYVLQDMVQARSWLCLAEMNVILNLHRHFNIPVTNIIGSHFNGEEANPTKDAIAGKQWFSEWHSHARCNLAGD